MMQSKVKISSYNVSWPGLLSSSLRKIVKPTPPHPALERLCRLTQSSGQSAVIEYCIANAYTNKSLMFWLRHICRR